MTLRYTDGTVFATGSCPYLDSFPGHETRTPRIVIQVEIEGQCTLAAVDTGGVYLMCDPEVASLIGLSSRHAEATTRVTSAYGNFDGSLHRVRLRINADQGDAVDVDASAFIPTLAPGQVWPFPSAILGYPLCLERLRIGIAPETRRLFFGSV